MSRYILPQPSTETGQTNRGNTQPIADERPGAPPARLFAYLLRSTNVQAMPSAPALLLCRWDYETPRLREVEPSVRRGTNRGPLGVSVDDYELREVGPLLSQSRDQLANITCDGTAYEEDHDGLASLSASQQRRVRNENAVFVRRIELRRDPAPQPARRSAHETDVFDGNVAGPSTYRAQQQDARQTGQVP